MIARMLHEARRARGMGLRELAQATDLDDSYISLLERGRRRAEPAVLLRIAQILEIDPLEVLRQSFLERVPEPFRSAAAEEADLGATFEYAAARRLQRRHHPYEIESAHVEIRIDWEGNAVMTRRMEGVRPLRADRSLWEVYFRERLPGDLSAPQGELRLTRCPDSLLVALQNDRSGEWERHRLVFEKGWRRMPSPDEDAISFTLTRARRKAFDLDPREYLKRVQLDADAQAFEGSYAHTVSSFVKRLRVTVDFPEGYAPKGWELRAWPATSKQPFPIDDPARAGIARTLELKASGGRGEIVADDPLIGYVLAIVWTPAPYEAYLEAKHRRVNDG